MIYLTAGLLWTHAKFQFMNFLPYRINLSNCCATLNQTHNSIQQRIFRNFILAFLPAMSIFLLFRLTWMFTAWNKLEADEKLVPFILYALALGLNALTSFTFYVIQSRPQLICYCVYQVVRSFPHQTSQSGNIPKLLAFGFSLTFFTIPFYGLVGPFLLDYFPIQFIYIWAFGEPIRWSKVLVVGIESLTYYLVMLYGGVYILSLLSVEWIIIEGVSILCKRLNKLNGSFSEAFATYQKLQVLIKAVDAVFYAFSFVLISIGIVLCSCCLYLIVKIRKQFPKFFVLVFLSVVIIAATLVNVFTYLADVPHSEGELFLSKWRKLPHNSGVDTRCLRVCTKDMGYRIVCYQVVKHSLGLQILAVIIDRTVVLILLK